MRHTKLSLALCAQAMLLTACAHTHEETETVIVAAPPPAHMDATEPDVVVASPPPMGRPRLSHTITLGQGAEPQYTPSPAAASTAPSQNVVVNNTVVVPGGRTGFYGGGYYGAGGYYGRSYSRGTSFYTNDGRFGGGRGWGSAWSSSGWEGARRTAAPGQTPGVGGNWSPPPSFGPAPMK